MVFTILIVLLVIAILGGLPNIGYGYNNGGGYGPSGLLGIILVVVLILLLCGRL